MELCSMGAAAFGQGIHAKELQLAPFSVLLCLCEHVSVPFSEEIFRYTHFPRLTQGDKSALSVHGGLSESWGWSRVTEYKLLKVPSDGGNTPNFPCMQSIALAEEGGREKHPDTRRPTFGKL